MPCTRTARRRISGLLLVALLFMQWVTAAHACPPAAAPVAVMQGECDLHAGQDAGALVACKAHCDQSHQVVKTAPDAGSAADVALAVDALPSIVVAWAGTDRPRPMAPTAAPPPGAPPLYLSFGVLRC
jgi:hypothetical protein